MGMSVICRSTINCKIVEQNPQVYFTVEIKHNDNKNLRVLNIDS